MDPKEPKKRERGLDLEEYLNPKSSLSSPSTFLHVLWLKKWKLITIWALIAVPAAVFLAFYDIPKTYSSVAYLRFPRVTGGTQNNVVRDVSMGEAESVVRLFLSQKVLAKTLDEMALRMNVSSKDVYRKHVIQSVSYSDQTMPGRYRFDFPGDRRVRVLYRPWQSRTYHVFWDGKAGADNSVPIPGGRIAFRAPLLEISNGFQVDMIFQTPDEALKDFAERLKVQPLDKGQVAVNYSIELQDRDPFLVADVLNHLTANFIQVYTGDNENQDADMLKQMKESIASARDNLNKAQDRLAEFYNKNQSRLAVKEGNPYALATAQTQKSQIESNLDRLTQSLAGKPNASDADQDKSLWMSEVLALLSGQGVQRAEALRGRITELEQKKVTMTATYSPAHPYVKAVDGEIADLFAPVARLADETRALYQTRLSQTASEIMRNLPGGAGDMSVTIEAKRLTDDRDNASKALEGLQGEYDRAKLSAGPNMFQVNVMDAARPPLYEAPNLGTRLVFSAAAAVLALFPGFIWALLSQILFPRIWNKDDAERKLKVKVAGSLFHMEDGPRRLPSALSKGGLTVDDRLLHHGRLSGSADVEAYRALRVELEHHFDTEQGREGMCILVSSTQPNEGKSLVAANLAVGFARRGRRTLLVDADFRHGRQERLFGYGPQRGLIDLLRSGVDPDFGRRAHSMLLPTVQANLAVMPMGVYDESATEAAYRAPMEYYLQMMKSAYEVVIVDGPPVIVTADPLNFARMARGVLYVLRSGQVSAREAARALEPFKDRQFPLLAVVNGIRKSPADDNYYARYGYYYVNPAVKPLPAEEIKKSDPWETHVGT
ncbi:MAG: Tyrosine-protein kinase EpsD [Fibrobacteres bacterium]|nr:Tyrosine-protein kinase EpsD [Fibrobacterota bacterium]